MIRHNCGFCVAHTLHDAYSFIKSLQHRGREAVGIAFVGDDGIDVIKWIGGVNKIDIDDLYNLFPSEKYHTYLAHVRYATRGRKDKILKDAHPHVIGGVEENKGSHVIITGCDAAIVHNGQVNPDYLGCEKNSSDCDTKILLQKYTDFGEKEMLKSIPGAYSLAIASKNRRGVVVLRDSAGIKPGALGWKDGKYIVASEDVAFRKNGGQFIEDLEPGCAYYLSPEGDYRKEKIVASRERHCFFEYNYICNVDSIVDGVSVRRLREMLGVEMAREFKISGDIVSFLPRCPEVAARKYAEERGIEFAHIFYKLRGERSFLGSTSEERRESISENLQLLPRIKGRNTRDFLNGKTLILIDDSTIRGNNSLRAVEILKNTGIKKVYLINYTPKIGIIPSDNIPRGCLYGVDMPPDDNFIARGNSDEQISSMIGAEVHFISPEGMFRAFESLGISRDRLCSFCIGGENPF